MNRSHVVVKNLIAIIATQVISWTLGLVVAIYLPRYIGAAGMGRLAEAGAFIAVFGSFVSLGTSFVLTKEIARAPGRAAELLSASIALRIPLSLIVAALAIAAASLIHEDSATRLIVLVCALGMILGNINDALGATLRGQNNFGRQSVANIVERFLWSVLTVGCIFYFSQRGMTGDKAPLWILAAIGIVTTAISVLINLSSFRALLPLLRRPHWPAVRSLALAGVPMMWLTVCQQLYGQIDPIALKMVANHTVAGWYGAAWRLVGTTYFVPTAIASALLPTLSRLHQESQADFRHMARRSLSFVMLCGVPMALVLVLMPDRLVALLHNPEFDHSIPVLRVAGAGIVVFYAGTMLGTLIVACDRQAQMLRAAIVAAIIEIPLCFLGSWVGQHWWGNGAVGAILSDVLIEVYLVGAYCRILPAGTLNSESLNLAGRYVLAALPMAGLLLLLLQSPLGAQGKIGLLAAIPCVIVYALMCWLLRCIHPQDIAVLRQILTRKASV